MLDQGRCPPLAHADLWQRAAAAWVRGSSEVRWVKAHLSCSEAHSRGITWQAWAGNQTADELAVRGAAVHAVAPAQVERVLTAQSATRRAQE